MPIKKKKVITRKIVNQQIKNSNKNENKIKQNTKMTGVLTTTKKPNASNNIANGAKECKRVPIAFPPANAARIPISKNRSLPTNPTYYQPTGLNSKEKSYVICSCQARSTRYLTLKYLAMDAIRNHKIFTVHGNCNAVRKALVDRGWVEKIPICKMNLTKIKNGSLTSKQEIQKELERLLLSNLVEKHPINFIWRTKDDIIDLNSSTDILKENITIENRLTADAIWTSKQGLCLSLKRNYWFYIEDVAEVSCPRTYNTSDDGEIEEFEKDYKITACTSVLKWVLSKVADESPVFSTTGKISLNVLVFALNMCKEYLFRKQNKDIDRKLSEVTSKQWNAFLKMYYRIINKEDIFKLDHQNKLPLYLGYANFLLEEMYKYRPQLSCEGCHNVWIIKPAHNSRGRGIRMASKLAVISSLLNKAKSRYVLQKYVEEPSLIHDTKFDIRQYYLVTSTYPLVIWMYRDCYLKFSSQKYNLMNYHESIHLTNNAVQRKYTNCTGRHPELPQNNMWHSDTYKSYLNNIGKGELWDNIIYPSMKKSIIGIMLSSQDSLVTTCRNRFELYGCDFIIDKMYKPWLIEINSGPDLNHTTSVTARICPAVVTDIIKVVIDYPNDRHCSTGKFECIYQQPMTVPKFGPAMDLYVQGYALPDSYFYKGTIPMKLDEAEIIKIRKSESPRTTMRKIKQFYDLGIELNETTDNDKTVCNRDSDELSVAATIITSQLEEFMEKLTSANHDLSKPTSRSPTPSQTKSALSVKSSTNFVTALKKSIARLASENDINMQQRSSIQLFNFSQLDDGPAGKASTMGVPGANKTHKHVKIKAVIDEDTCKTNIESNYTSSSKNIIQEASTDIVNFITQKQKEYSINTNSNFQ